MYSIQNFIQRNFKKIPYFFERKIEFNNESYNYMLFGKLSSSILHDILTPLTSLLLATETKQNIHKKIIKDSTRELRQYVEILRNFTYQNILETPLHVNKEISKSIILLRHKSIMHNVQIQFIEFDQIYSKIQPLHLYQIIVNLISNAIEGSLDSETKKVILTLKKTSDHFEITCRDFGKGIPQDILKRIGKDIKSTKSHTRGFGLYSIYNTVEKILCGKITVHTKENFGTIFICKIPII